MAISEKVVDKLGNAGFAVALVVALALVTDKRAGVHPSPGAAGGQAGKYGGIKVISG